MQRGYFNSKFEDNICNYWIFLVEDNANYMLFGDNVCIMGIIRAKDNAIYAFRDNSSLSIEIIRVYSGYFEFIGIFRVYRDISSSISSH